MVYGPQARMKMVANRRRVDHAVASGSSSRHSGALSPKFSLAGPSSGTVDCRLGNESTRERLDFQGGASAARQKPVWTFFTDAAAAWMSTRTRARLRFDLGSRTRPQGEVAIAADTESETPEGELQCPRWKATGLSEGSPAKGPL